jgi:hypothetical protein
VSLRPRLLLQHGREAVDLLSHAHRASALQGFEALTAISDRRKSFIRCGGDTPSAAPPALGVWELHLMWLRYLATCFDTAERSVGEWQPHLVQADVSI